MREVSGAPMHACRACRAAAASELCESRVLGELSRDQPRTSHKCLPAFDAVASSCTSLFPRQQKLQNVTQWHRTGVLLCETRESRQPNVLVH